MRSVNGQSGRVLALCPTLVAESLDMATEDTVRAMLELAAAFYRYEGARHVAIREQFDMTATRFYQRVNELIDDPLVITAHPDLVLPLRRRREQRGRLKRAV